MSGITSVALEEILFDKDPWRNFLHASRKKLGRVTRETIDLPHKSDFWSPNHLWSSLRTAIPW